jgi:eukaryotic-like serine/threonine-protein kinase
MSQTESSPQPGRHLPPVQFPTLRSNIGGFTLVQRLGSGSYGTVYLARRGDRRYALKLISLGQAEEWGWRELEVLARLQHVGGLELVSHGLWPEGAPGWLFIAMEYVKGPTLKVWSREHNPTSHEVATVMLALAEDLEQVHAAGVIHRDIKPSNVVVREADGRAVLVDYGVSTYKGALSVTGPAQPGTRLYRSPEALRFLRERHPGSYQARREDDLFSLGVVFYELLAGEHPFDTGSEEAYQEALLACAPVPPRQLNPCVPEELGEVCLGLLRANPKERPSAKGLQAELRAAQQGAGVEWEQPLFDESRFAEQQPEEQEAWPEREPTTPLPPTREEPAPAESAAPAPRQRSTLALVVALGLVLSGVALGVALGVGLLLAPRLLSTLQPGQHTAAGREVASAPKALEGGSGAEPPVGASPAPKVVDSMSETKQETKVLSPPLLAPRRTSGAGASRWSRVAPLACTLAACASAPPVRSRPGPEACPSGALEAMRSLDIRIGQEMLAGFELKGGNVRALEVREGDTQMWIGQDLGRLEPGTRLQGRLLFSADTVYGRFTRAVAPDGRSYPVCVQMRPTPMSEGSQGGPVKIASYRYVQAVSRFE